MDTLNVPDRFGRYNSFGTFLSHPQISAIDIEIAHSNVDYLLRMNGNLDDCFHKSILIIDTDLLVRWSIERVLSRFGISYSVH